jgi:hypothetical protein
VSALRERIGRGEHLLWVDYVDYAGRLLAPQGIPWADTAATVAWFRQAQGLLGSEVVTVPLWAVVERLAVTTPGLPEQMRAKSRVTHALRVVLSNERVREATTGLVTALHAVFPQALLALNLPMPRTAIELARQMASGAPEAATIGEDEIDTAAPYLADFLRGFGEAGIDLLLLEQSDAGATADDLQWCAPVLNTARHYGWDLGLSTWEPDAAGSTGIDFVVERAVAGSPDDLDPHPVHLPGISAEGRFDYLAVPREAAPERVLEALRRYREGPVA